MIQDRTANQSTANNNSLRVGFHNLVPKIIAISVSLPVEHRVKLPGRDISRRKRTTFTSNRFGNCRAAFKIIAHTTESAPMPSLKRKLHDSDTRLTAVVCTIPSATVTQAIAASGVDAVIIDLEHGAVDYASAHAMIAATAGTECAPLVRVAQNDEAQVKRALDLGAEGIVFPLIRTVEDATIAVASLRYPPRGTRGFGPFLAQSRWQTSLPAYQADIEDQLVCCLLIETVEAVTNIDAICAVESVDIIVLAAFDLSTSLGISGQFDHPYFLAAQEKIETAAQKAGMAICGVALIKEQSDAALAKGYRMIGGFDILWLRQKAAELTGWASE
jgi:4-hydroxy-2-oxoheptanedioate aldolase